MRFSKNTVSDDTQSLSRLEMPIIKNRSMGLTCLSLAF